MRNMSRRGIAIILCVVLSVFFLYACNVVAPANHDANTTTAPIILNTSPQENTQLDAIPSTESTTEGTADIEDDSLSGDSYFEIHYLDVGQGDASLVICDGEAMLIDGGDPEYSSLLYSYLSKNSLTYLKYVVCTHAHEDHCGGIAGALSYANLGIAYCSVTEYNTKAFQNFVASVEKHGKTIAVPSPGDVFTLGSATVSIIGPVNPSEDPNNMSIALRIDYGQTSFLFTGDAEREEELDILNAGHSVDCTVLHVGHHGSDTSTTYPFLRAAAPEYAVISCGAGNEYGHPTENTLSKLRDAKVKVYRTDMQGHIICQSDGVRVTFTVSRNASADTLNGAGAGGNHGDDATVPTENETDAVSRVTYVLNISTMKFHYPTCSSVDSMSEKNRREVSLDRSELIAQGYSPCGRCKP